MVVLALLAEEPMHVYRIRRLIQIRRKDDVVNVERSNSIYQAIERLLRDGLVAVHAREEPAGAPTRTVYAITDAGLSTLESWMDTALSTPAREFPEFRAVLAVVGLTRPAVVRDALRQRATALEDTLSRTERDMRSARGAGLARVLLLEDEHLAAVTRAELGWVRAVVADLEAGTLDWTAEELLEGHPPVDDGA
ncbi:PadR family transcriptional regulator [Myceligenerans sp. TRM 65318]|uniref:PadR family transcriptional regulator n=2 Tax=Myceligenerans pegani TaxID=2776917 RepID=A0ABR9N4K3_9MICO|nr:PadR family transcriptional regulator [Myceligenerans sp. TRM 65318]MBE3020377.1 PadR family transcriptional regulator [Myceligenerans sp. TRM 65318]